MSLSPPSDSHLETGGDLIDSFDFIISSDDKKAFATVLVTRAKHLPDILRNSKDYYPAWK